MPYMVTFTINIPPMLAYIPYMDPMGMGESFPLTFTFFEMVKTTNQILKYNDIMLRRHWNDEFRSRYQDIPSKCSSR